MIAGEKESLLLSHFAPEVDFLVVDARMVTDQLNLQIFWADYFQAITGRYHELMPLEMHCSISGPSQTFLRHSYKSLHIPTQTIRPP